MKLSSLNVNLFIMPKEIHVFIDDNGDKKHKYSYNRTFINNPPSYIENKTFWQKNYFVLTGAIIDKKYFDFLNKKLINKKLKYFDTSQVEIKSEWLRISQQRRKKYIDKFNISNDNCNNLGIEYLDLIRENTDKIKLISVIFDKRYYGEAKRLTANGDPFIMSCHVLLERLKMIGHPVHVHFDQFDSNLKVTKGHHKAIHSLQYSKIPITRYTDNMNHIKHIDFKKSSTENFLQLVDIASYNVYRQFVEHGREWENSSPKTKLSLYTYFSKIKNNFLNKDNNICGVGIVKLPDNRNFNWNIINNDGVNILKRPL